MLSNGYLGMQSQAHGWVIALRLGPEMMQSMRRSGCRGIPRAVDFEASGPTLSCRRDWSLRYRTTAGRSEPAVYQSIRPNARREIAFSFGSPLHAREAGFLAVRAMEECLRPIPPK